MELSHTIIYVPNVQASIVFYEKAFQLKTLFLHESKQYAELDTGNTKLAFASENLAESNGVEFTKNNAQQTAPGFEITLSCDDVKKAYDHACEQGATSVKAPIEKPWGQTVAYVRDLNGILVGTCSRM